MTKAFDSVEFQRERRVELSKKLAKMSKEEILKYFKSRGYSTKRKKVKRATTA